MIVDHLSVIDQNQWTHQPSSGNIPCTKCLWQDLSPSNSTFCMNASGKIAPSNEDQQNTAKWAKTNWHFYMWTIQLADKILHTSIRHKHKWPITSCTHTYYYISKNIMECILQYNDLPLLHYILYLQTGLHLITARTRITTKQFDISENLPV